MPDNVLVIQQSPANVTVNRSVFSESLKMKTWKQFLKFPLPLLSILRKLKWSHQSADFELRMKQVKWKEEHNLPLSEA